MEDQILNEYDKQQSNKNNNNNNLAVNYNQYANFANDYAKQDEFLDRLDEEWRQKQFDYQASSDNIADSQWQA